MTATSKAKSAKTYKGNVHLRHKDSSERYSVPACKAEMSLATPKEAFTTDTKKVTCGNCTRTSQFKAASTMLSSTRARRGTSTPKPTTHKTPRRGLRFDDYSY